MSQILYKDLRAGEKIILKERVLLGDRNLLRIYDALNLEDYDERGHITYVDENGVSIHLMGKDMDTKTIEGFFLAGTDYTLSNFFTRENYDERLFVKHEHYKKRFPSHFLRKDK